ncbi:MAG: FixG Ig-like domain-containing protein, partial [Pseudomonadota bacterium]
DDWTWRRLKTMGYGGALLVMVIALSLVLLTSRPLDLEAERTRGALYQELPGGQIQNVYLLKILNKDSVNHRFTLNVHGIESAQMLPDGLIDVPAGSAVEISRQIVVGMTDIRETFTDITFEVSTGNGLAATAKSRFIAPDRNRRP